MDSTTPAAAVPGAWTSEHATLYAVNALPDRDDPVYRLTAGGDVRRAIRACHELLLRSLATLPAGSAALVFRFVFSPVLEPSKRQSRLTITVQTLARDEQLAQTLRLLVECSDLPTYYDLQTLPARVFADQSCSSACHITRLEQAIRPLHAPAENPAIPGTYYACRPFIPKSSNDYLGLDRILDRLTEPVQIDLRIEPADVTEERFLHSRYLARLQSINRFHGSDDEDGGMSGDPFEPDRYHRSNRADVIQPLRRRDPIADDILSGQRRFHETLSQPHLKYGLLVKAPTPMVARLVASVVAESAFDEGCYKLWSSGSETTPSAPLQPCVADDSVTVPPTLELVLGEHAAAYRGFSRLARVATVDELLGVFALPIASRSGARCIRMNTEPKITPREHHLIFGHDE